MKDNFKFWVPIDIKKAKDNLGNEVMKIGGIASTSEKDTDGEFLDPNGFNLDYFRNQGYLNYHHQAKNDPKAIIGEPTLAEIRKEGLYVEGILYPDSELARAVWDTAQTLEKNSSNRRLGFSIEGKATKRKSMDEKHPDYKIIQKADISGCAITFSPKNPKTFLDIIKGNVDETVEEYDDETLELIKALSAGSITGRDTTNVSVAGEGAPLKSDNVSTVKNIISLEEDDDEKKSKNKKLTKAEIYEHIFAKHPVISLTDAEKVFHYINKISMQTNDVNKVDVSDVEKALGLLDKAQDLVKASATKEEIKKSDDEDEDDDDSEDVEKAKDTEEDKEKVLAVFKKKKAAVDKMEKALIEKGIMPKIAKAEKEEEKEDEDKEDKKPDFLKKGFDFEKGITDVSQLIKEKNYSVGIILKGIYDELAGVKEMVVSLKEENSELKKALGESKDSFSSFENKITDLSKSLDEPNFGRKSIQTSSFRERNFGGNTNQDLTKGNTDNVVSIKERKKILEVLDVATFEKGYDSEFAEAMTNFESLGTLSGHIVNRLANERKTIIK